MTIEATDWLPVEALVDPRLAARLDELVPRWSERWFGSANMCKFAGFGRGKTSAKLPATATTWRPAESGISCGWSDQLGLKLGLAIVDAADSNRPRSSSDKALLSGLAWEALSDLTAMAARSLGIEAGSQRPTTDCGHQIGWQTRNTLKQIPELAFKVPASALVPARKALIGSSHSAALEGGKLSDMCADASLPVRAILGEARISWSECRNLEVGDVVVLNQTLDQPFTLLATRSGSEICQLSLAQEGGGLQLLVTKAED